MKKEGESTGKATNKSLASKEKFMRISKWVRVLALIGCVGSILGAIAVLAVNAITIAGVPGTEPLTNLIADTVGDQFELKGLSHELLVTLLVVATICEVAILCATAYLLSMVAKLFENFRNDTTPFTLENVNMIKRIAKASLVLLILQLVSLGILDESASSGVGLMTTLVIYAMTYVFEYGYELQHKAKA